jgi:diketogulonate reductase-like aldo/keto reductase
MRDIGVCSYSIDAIEELVYRTGEMPAVKPRSSGRRSDTAAHAGLLPRETKSSSRRGVRLTHGKRLGDDKMWADGRRALRQGTPAQLLLRWNLQLGVVPLPKATTCSTSARKPQRVRLRDPAARTWSA